MTSKISDKAETIWLFKITSCNSLTLRAATPTFERFSEAREVILPSQIGVNFIENLGTFFLPTVTPCSTHSWLNVIRSQLFHCDVMSCLPWLVSGIEYPSHQKSSSSHTYIYHTFQIQPPSTVSVLHILKIENLRLRPQQKNLRHDNSQT